MVSIPPTESVPLTSTPHSQSPLDSHLKPQLSSSPALLKPFISHGFGSVGFTSFFSGLILLVL